MIHTTELYRLLKQMESVVGACPATLEDGEVLASWTDDAALRQAQALVGRALRLVEKEPIPPATAVAMTNSASLSSVQIEGRQKGPPAITVKVYAGDAAEALVEATVLYDRAVAKYAAQAKVGVGDA